MSRNAHLNRGAGLMVVGAAIFLIYAIVVFFRGFAGLEGIGAERAFGTSVSNTAQRLSSPPPADLWINRFHSRLDPGILMA